MSPIDWIATVVGGVLVMVVLRDVFHTLLHPAGVGQLSPRIFRAVWRGSRHRATPSAALAGPLGFVAVAATWAGLIAIGWALIYWPHLPGSFVITDGLETSAQDGVLDALYVSLVTLTTLGFGDLVPEATALRLAFGIEAALGFALLTALISWVLSIYPVLVRSRTLAARLSSMVQGRGEEASLAPGRSPTALAAALDSVADQLDTAHVDLLQFPSTYFFLPPSRELSLPPKLLDLRTAVRRVPPEATGSAMAVDAALDRLSHTLATGPYGLDTDPRTALRDWAEDHRR